jgi:C-methyltransferase
VTDAAKADFTAIMPPTARKIVPLFMQMSLGQLLKTAVELGVPAALGDEPAAADELAAQVGADPGALRRLLDALTTFGVFRRTDDGRYAHTELSAELAAEAGQTLAAFLAADWFWLTWSDLTNAVRTGATPFPQRHGKDFFGFLMRDNPEAAMVFNKAMTLLMGSLNEAHVAALDLASSTTVVDLGGGQGSLVRDLLNHHPHLRGVLFDIEPAVAHAVPELREAPLADRCSLVPGDAFESIPDGADAYVLRNVLHMWDDEKCVKVLENLVRAAAPGARVFVLEMVVPDRQENPFPPLLDLLMLLLLGGRERNEAQFAELLERAGLKYTGITRTPTMCDVVEARVP